MAATGFLYRAYQARLVTEVEIRAIGKDALAKIQNNLGKEVVSWSMAGKSFSKELTMTPQDMLDEVAYALSLIGNDGVPGGVRKKYATIG